MATKIPWCDETWNYITGCDADCVREECRNCYARRMAKRLAGRCGYHTKDPFRITRHADKRDLPVTWTKSKVIFVDSMGDLFHPDVPWKWIFDAFEVMLLAPWHSYIILTKYPERLATELRDYIWPSNVYIGVSVSDQATWNMRVPKLLKLHCRKLVSVEPMLAEVEPVGLKKLHGVFCGPETGPGARPFDSTWLLSLMGACLIADIPFFNKQDIPCAWREMPIGLQDVIKKHN